MPEGARTHALHTADVLSRILALLGMQHWHAVALVCHSWRAAAVAKAVEWRVLEPTAASALPADAASVVCIVELPDGSLCLSDTANHQLVIAGTTPLRRLSKQGYQPGELEKPTGVACDGERLFIVERDASRVQAWRLDDGAPLAQSGRWLRRPRGAAVVGPHLFVADTGSDRVVRLCASDLAFELSFGQHGSAPGEFDAPCGVASDGAELVVVSDLCNHRLQVFDLDGELSRVVGGGGRGGAPGRFAGPWGVAIRGGHLYVAEMAARRVQVLSWPGCEPRQLVPLPAASEMGLRGVAVGGDGTAYVADLRARRLWALASVAARAPPPPQERRAGPLLQTPAAAAAETAAAPADTGGGEAVETLEAAEEAAERTAVARPRRLRGAGFEVEEAAEEVDVEESLLLGADGIRRLQIAEDDEDDDEEERVPCVLDSPD